SRTQSAQRSRRFFLCALCDLCGSSLPKRIMRIPIILLSTLCALASGSSFIFKQTDSLPPKPRGKSAKFEVDSVLADPRERHLANIKQLTNEGENAEAYLSPDGKQLI